MTHGSPFPRRVLAALILVLALVPVVTWWLLIGRAPGLPAAAARERIRSGDPPAVLVDVRAPAEFAAGHVAGAVNWPFAELARIAGPAEVPAPLRDRELLLLCDSGIHGAAAARHLAPMLGDRVASVRDGMRGWIAEDAVAGPTALAALQGGVAVPLPAPWRESPAHEQWAAVLTGFVVKPIYMLMALLGIVVLWRSAAADLVALRWGLILFLAGESACAINYLLFRDGSHLSEYLHSLGMVLAFGFVTHALMEGLDHRFVHYSEPDQRCAAIKLCQTCFKYKPVPCGLQRLFLVAIPATAVLAGLPLLSPLRASAYNTTILGGSYHYSHPVIYQLFEARYCPVVAIVLLAAAFLVLWFGKRSPVERSRVLFAGGAGVLGFGLFRQYLLASYHEDLVWFAFWEEVTELMFLVAVAAVLWWFRRGLLGVGRAVPAGRTDAAPANSAT